MRANAFTRLELLITIVALTLIAAVALPTVAGTRTSSERAGCFNNLRRMGVATAQWATDHNDYVPWRTRVSDGGTQPDAGSKVGLAWVEWMTLSNQLVTPQLLACPADGTAKVANHWGNTAGGLANTGFRNVAVSYIVNYHVVPYFPRSVITTDRDFEPYSRTPGQCAYGANNVASVLLGQPTPVKWRNILHHESGHGLFTDGAVELLGTERLYSVLAGGEVQVDTGSLHLIFPRY